MSVLAALSILVVLAVGLIVVGVLVQGSPVSTRDLAWIGGTSALAADEREVYARYLQRHRRHRAAGGVLGVAVAVVVGVRWYSRVGFGVDATGPLGDVLVCGLAGVLVGALSAESFRLAQPRGDVAASLGGRRPLPGGTRSRAALLVAAGSLVVGTGGAFLGGSWRGAAAAVVGLVVVLVGTATRSAIAGRRRPVMSDRAVAVDTRMRAFAADSVAWLQCAAAALAGTWALVGLLPPSDTGWSWLPGVAGLVATAVLLHRASARPPRGFVA